MFFSRLVRFSDIAYERMMRYERMIFLLFMLITLLQLWLTKFVPSLDGPQHLYNASALSYLIKGNELFQIFFRINETIVGYWTAHFLLALFTSFLPAWLAEKLFLTTYVLAMVFSFRYLVKSVQPAKSNFIMLLIFPFVYHSFILMGYYAFSLATVFFFLAFGYYIHNRDRLMLKQLIIFALLLLLLFLTHGLVYVLFLVSFILFYGTISLHSLSVGREAFSWRIMIYNSVKLLAAALPSLVLWFFYINRVMAVDSTVAEASLSTKELVVFLMRIRQLVGFHHELEAVGYIPLFILLVVLSLVVLIFFFRKMKDGSGKLIDLLNLKHSWLIVAALFLGLYFFAPERISAGSLTNRFGLWFFFMIIVWLSMQKLPKTIQVITVVVVLFSISYSRVVHQRFYSKLNKDIEELTELTAHMEPNSVVEYRRHSKNWTHLHFQLYAALDKPLVHIRNSQCYGPFPMVWNYEALPRCYAGEQLVRPSGALKVGEDHPVRDIDYVTVFYYDNFWNDTTETEWQRILGEDYTEIHKSKRGRTALYASKRSAVANSN